MRFLMCLIAFMAIYVNSFCQCRECINIYFKADEYKIDSLMLQNANSIKKLHELFSMISSDSLIRLVSVDIKSYTSPDGGSSYNQDLANKRLASIRNFIDNSSFPIPDSIITSHSCGIAWEQLRDMVDTSEMPYRAEVLDILDNIPVERWQKLNPNDKWLTMVDSRNRQLMELHYGAPYRYMSNELFPYLRGASMTTIYYEFLPRNSVKYMLLSRETPTLINTSSHNELSNGQHYKKPLFAIKTNLLFDLFTLVNLEIEVPIGEKWSVAGEMIFPWWVWDNKEENSKRNRIQMLNGNIEGRYWLGNRINKDILTGWFTGIYAGGGLYDFEHKHRGYQGEFFIAAGVSGGYAHTINKAKTLRLEYSIGLGYLKTKYRYYEANCYFDDRWHPVEHRRGHYSWFGPTRAKVSLSWLLKYNRNK